MSDAPLPARQPTYRISDAERDAVIARLRSAMGEGRIDLAEFEDRLSVVYGARVASDLLPVVADLPPPPADPAAVKAERRHRRRRRRQGFYGHLVPYLSVNGFLVMIWAITTPGGHFWPAYPAGGWGIGLAAHAWAAFSGGGDPPREVQHPQAPISER